MSQSATTCSRFIGCDVGKTSIVVYDSADGRLQTIANGAEALAAFATQLDQTCLVVCEATGGYEAGLLDALLARGVPTHRADARKVKAFIRSFGTLGKTDALDAKALAGYAKERNLQLRRWQAPSRDHLALQALVLTRSDLVQQQTAWSNRLQAPGAEPVASCLRQLLDCLADQIDAIEVRIQNILDASQPLQQTAAILRAIRGIGFKTAAALIALMPELGSLNRKQAAALAGLAPHPRQSGFTDAYRRTKGGRPEVKRVLFMAALSAAQHDPVMRAFFQRLTAAGKKPIVAITAVMRKIIVVANARLRDAKIPNHLS